ncbi:MAG: S-layer protein [Methanomicrobiales archaeon]|nr:S-layer protein [Methanomicrobiales archaeon]NYT21944.1 S-layer protein [Methanomicrobiales archaeon]
MTTISRVVPSFCLALLGMLMLAGIPACAAPLYLSGSPDLRAGITGSNELLPGETVDLVIHLENQGRDARKVISPDGSTGSPPSTAIAITAALTAGSAPVVVKTDPQMVGNIGAGEGVRIPFSLLVLPDAAGGDYMLPLTLNYTWLSSEELVGMESVIYHYTDETTTIALPIRVADVVFIDIGKIRAENLSAGGEGYVIVPLENTGSLEGKSAVARISRVAESPVIPVTGTVYIGDFAPGAVHEARFKVAVDRTAEAGSYPMQVAVGYLDSHGENKTSRMVTIGIPVAARTAFSVQGDPLWVYRGSRASLEITYENTGTTPVYSAQARISAVEPFTGYDDTATLGDLGPGERATARFDIGVDKTATVKAYGLDTEVRYRDGLDQDRISDPVTVTVEVRERSGISRIVHDPVIMSVLVALVIGFLYYHRVYRNRKPEQPEE